MHGVLERHPRDNQKCHEEIPWSNGSQDSCHQDPILVEDGPSKEDISASQDPYQEGDCHPKITEAEQYL